MLLPLLPIAQGSQAHVCSCLALYMTWAQVPLLAQHVLLLTGPSLQPRSWNFLHVVVVSCELLKSLGTWNISEFGLAKRNLYHHLSFDEFTKAFIIFVWLVFIAVVFSLSFSHRISIWSRLVLSLLCNLGGWSRTHNPPASISSLLRWDCYPTLPGWKTTLF